MSRFFYKKQCDDGISAQLDIIDRHHKNYEKCCHYISAIYHKNYQANVNPNPDIIIAYTGKKSNHLDGCVGMSFPAPEKELFSERYLKEVVQNDSCHQLHHALALGQLVELGSLASDSPSAAIDFIRILPIITWFMGVRIILCTATRRLRKILAAHHIPFSVLADASAECLSPREKKAWGSYYTQEPQTGIIALEKCGHLFDYSCGHLIFSDFEALTRSVQTASPVAA